MRIEQKRSGDQEYYHLTEEQVKLIREMHFNWMPGSEIGYEGGPCIDAKRPFGNSSVESDVWEIIDPRPYEELREVWEEADEDDRWEEVEEEQQAVYARYYRTLAQALQVVLSSGSFEPGIYSCNKYCRNYQLVTDEREIFKAKLILGDNHAVPEDGRFGRY